MSELTNLEKAKEQGKQAAPNVIDAAKAGEITTDITMAEQQGNQAGLLLAENFKGTELYERMKEQGNRAIPLIVEGFESGAGDVEPSSYNIDVITFVGNDNIVYPTYRQDRDVPDLYVDFYMRIQKGYKAIDFADPNIFLYFSLLVNGQPFALQYHGAIPKPEDPDARPEYQQVFYTIDTTRLNTEEEVQAASLTFGITFNIGDRLSHITLLGFSTKVADNNSIIAMSLYRRMPDNDDAHFYCTAQLRENVMPTDRGIIPDITGHGHFKLQNVLYDTNPIQPGVTSGLIFMLVLLEGRLGGGWGYEGLNVFLDCDTLPIEAHPQINSTISYYVDSDLQTWVDSQNKNAYMLLFGYDLTTYTGEHTITVRALTSKGLEVGVVTAILG